MVVAGVAGEIPVESYRARGGSRIARPTAATSRAITTIDTVSIIFTPNAPIRRDAKGAYSRRAALLRCNISRWLTQLTRDAIMDAAATAPAHHQQSSLP